MYPQSFINEIKERVDLKEFRRTYGTKNLSFAKEEDLMNILGLIPGSVSPLGLLNDKENKVHFYLDKEFTEKDALIGVHPNENGHRLLADMIGARIEQI